MKGIAGRLMGLGRRRGMAAGAASAAPEAACAEPGHWRNGARVNARPGPCARSFATNLHFAIRADSPRGIDDVGSQAGNHATGMHDCWHPRRHQHQVVESGRVDRDTAGVAVARIEGIYRAPLATKPRLRTYFDFLYWTFSGRPPGVGDSDSEDFDPPRWRSAAFAVTYTRGGKAQVAFKARQPTMIDGIYLTVAPSSPAVYRTVVETTSGATLIDPAAPAGTYVTAVGLERDGLRNGWLAVAASMLNPATSESWAGVYVTRTDKKK